MPQTFVTADLHLGHAGVCRFLRPDGTKLRPWDDPDLMTEDMVRFWNETVKPDDRVYVLGDVVINRSALKHLGRLMGRKCLIKGNHDIFHLEDYTPYFDDIRAYQIGTWVDKRVVMSHVPIHPKSLERWDLNIHGHLHAGQVGDPKYHCVSVEHTNYRPVEMHALIKSLR